MLLLVQIGWTLAAVAGLLISIANCRDALGDDAAMRVLGTNGTRQIVSDMGIRNETGRLALFTVMLVIGVVSLLDGHIAAMIRSNVLLFGLLLIAFLNVALALADRRDRNRLYSWKMGEGET